ncbi:winged helix-turn-helix domain-containing protein [Microbacterium sp.]|uniref:winged helix-turn-helix domain-containing protein n=1 Tax=Microbacterium sp. TaxID=51671 RepID=UPI003F97D834
MVTTQTLSAAQARRVALGAQGFSGARPASVGVRRLHAGLERMGALQIDSVNVFSRTHYMPHFSRFGPYDRDRLDRLVLSSGGRYVEYRAHEAAFVPVEDWPVWQFRMEHFRRRFASPGEWAHAHAAVLDRLRDELAARGPLRPAEIDPDSERGRRGPWWDWDDVKRGLEVMWLTGEVAIAGRRGFERRYALAEHVVPPEHLHREVSPPDAIRELTRRAAQAYGVATTADLADYYRLRAREVAPAVDDLVASGELTPVRVPEWERSGRAQPAWLHRDAVVPRRIERTALLTPFDPVVWFRSRALRTFGLDYRIEIYVPAAQRRYGYYSLPVLVDDRIAARIDLKADRSGSRLLVQSAWWEPSAQAEDAARIADELRLAADWQGLETVSVSTWGDATDELAAVLGGADRHDHPRATGVGQQVSDPPRLRA